MDQLDNNNNSDAVVPYTNSTPVVNMAHAESLIQSDTIDQSLLLDTCPSMSLISNPALLHNIQTINRTLHVQCNAETVATSQSGYLGNDPNPACFNPNGIPNILSQNEAAQHYHLTMEVTKNNQKQMHQPNKTPISSQWSLQIGPH